MKHIGFLTPEYIIPPKRVDGGLANYIYKTSHSLAQKGIKATVFLLSNRNFTWYDSGVTVVEIKKKRLHIGRIRKLPFLRLLIPICEFFVSLVWIRRVINIYHHRYPLDIVQVSTFKSLGLLLNNKKFIVVCRISSFTPLWDKALKKEPTLYNKIFYFIEKAETQKADFVYSPSKLMSSIYSGFLKKPPFILRTPIDEITEFVDESLYFNKLNAKKYLLFFGTLSRVKGADIIAEVIPTILEKNDEINFVLIGRDVNDISLGSMVEYIKKRNACFQDRIFYFPPQPKSILYGMIKNALAIILPSKVDNYPNACLEAQQFGKIVISTHNSSLDEMICEGKTGFLAKNDNSESLTNKIEELLNLSNSEIIEMQNNINNYIKSIKSDDRIGQLINFYEKCIKEKEINLINSI